MTREEQLQEIIDHPLPDPIAQRNREIQWCMTNPIYQGWLRETEDAASPRFPWLPLIVTVAVVTILILILILIGEVR